jgi:hypothetical protein
VRPAQCAAGLAGVAPHLAPSCGHPALIPDACGPGGPARCACLPIPLLEVGRRSCCSLHRITAFSPSRAARFACLQGKALRAIPAARCLAPLDAAEPAAPARPGIRSRKGRGASFPMPGTWCLSWAWCPSSLEVWASPAKKHGRSRCRASHRATFGVSPLSGFHRSLALLG